MSFPLSVNSVSVVLAVAVAVVAVDLKGDGHVFFDRHPFLCLIW